jgi:hypothetical protein
MNTPVNPHLAQELIYKYVNLHPRLQTLYREDSITYNVMVSSAKSGLDPLVMMLNLALAQTEARTNLEDRLRQRAESAPTVHFTIPKA